MVQRLAEMEKQRMASSNLSSPTFSNPSIRPLSRIAHSPHIRPLLPAPGSHTLHLSPFSHPQQQTWNPKTQAKSPLPASHGRRGAYLSTVLQPPITQLHLPGNSSDHRAGNTPTALLTYRCGLCGEDLLSQTALERHIASDHSASRG